MPLQPAVFLDRDGVVNAMWLDPEHGTIDSPANPEQFRLLPEVGSAIRQLRERGWLTVVISNQPGIAKGKFSPRLLEAMTQKMHDELAATGARVDGVYYCLHHPEAIVPEYRQACECRKPQPGLLKCAAQERGIDLGRSYMIGDGINDIKAGQAAGCRTIWIGNVKCDQCQLQDRQQAKPDGIAKDLWAAVELIDRG